LSISVRCAALVNGQRLSGGQQLSAGQRLQFGESGPVFRVVGFGEVPKPAESYFPHRAAAPDPFHSKPPISPYQDPFAVKAPIQEQYQREQQLPQQYVHHVEEPRPYPPVQQPPALDRPPSGGAELDFVDSAARFKLSQNIWIGRETVCEIRFDPGDVMVSQAPSIRYEGQFYTRR
jgi:hypothetical protein